MNLFIILVIIVTFFMFLIKFIVSLTGRVSERILTRYFRSVEALFAQNKLPEEWVKHLEKLAKARQRSLHLPRSEQAKAFLLKKITELRKFFKTCRFVESEDARGMLIYQIDNLKERWQSSDASEILSFYNIDIDFDYEPGEQNQTIHRDSQ